MKYLAVAVLVIAAFFAWKKFGASAAPAPAPAASPDTTPAANMDNRVNNLSGTVPSP